MLFLVSLYSIGFKNSPCHLTFFVVVVIVPIVQFVAKGLFVVRVV